MTLLAHIDDPLPLSEAATELRDAIWRATADEGEVDVGAVRLRRFDGSWACTEVTWKVKDRTIYLRFVDFVVALDELTQRRLTRLAQRVIVGLDDLKLADVDDAGWAEVEIDFDSGRIDDLRPHSGFSLGDGEDTSRVVAETD